MESGPVPPHERTWRHPSEIAAEERRRALLETMSPSARALALTWGALGLVSVGVLVLTVAPERSGLADVARTEASLLMSAQAALAPARPMAVRAVATPIRLAGGSDPSTLAVVTALDLTDDASSRDEELAVPERGSPVEVAVPSGRTHTALVVGHVGDTVIVRLEHDEPGLHLRSFPPLVDETVTVLASPPLHVTVDDIPTLEVAEGTAVVDASGALVGLCTRRDRWRVRLAPLDDVSISSGLETATSVD
ncbi:MAG: hypothetical protein ACO4AY_05195 [Ilumatobacteraceae bacterium]